MYKLQVKKIHFCTFMMINFDFAGKLNLYWIVGDNLGGENIGDSLVSSLLNHFYSLVY